MNDQRYAVITGSSMGLGRAFARQAASRGWNQILVSLPGTGLPETASAIEAEYGVDVEYFEMDLTDRRAREALSGWIRWNGVEIGLLVNNAGVGCPGTFAGAPEAMLVSVVDLNTQALTHLTYLLLPDLERTDGSTIINVASLAAFYPMPSMAVYAATKAYVLSFSLAIREELSGSGVSVSVLCPGGIATNPEVTARIRAQGVIGRLSALTPDRIAAKTLASAARGRAVIVPGWMNKILRSFGASVPKPIVARIIGGRFSKTEANARMIVRAAVPALETA